METAQLVGLAVQMRAKQWKYSAIIFTFLFIGMSALVWMLVDPTAEFLRIAVIGLVAGFVGVLELHLLILLQMRALLNDLERKPSYVLTTKYPAEKVKARVSRVFTTRNLPQTTLDHYIGGFNELLLSLVGVNTQTANQVVFTSRPFVAVRVTSDAGKPATVSVYHSNSRESVTLAEVLKTNLQIS